MEGSTIQGVDWSVKARLEGCDWFALLQSDCESFRQQWIMDGREGYINLFNHLGRRAQWPVL